MNVIIFRNKGYQEYKDLVSRDPSALEDYLPESFGSPKGSSPGRRRKKRTLKKRIAMFLVTVISSTLTIVLIAYLLHEYRISLQKKQIITTHSTAPSKLKESEELRRAKELLDNPDTLWDCDEEGFTNNPRGAKKCEYIWENVSQSKTKVPAERYILPSSRGEGEGKKE